MERFDGIEVFITGASKGIGKAIAEMYVERGARVTAPTRQTLNLASADSVGAYIMENADAAFDIMIFCAGVNNKASIEDVTSENMLETYQVNLFSSVQLLKYYVRKMKEKGKGKIIFISSLYSMVSREERISYSSSKSAITGLVKTLALELAPDNICVNAVAPGYVMTEMTRKNLTKEDVAEIERMIPTHRFQQPEEIAEVVLFLSSDRNMSITGQLLAVDGGFLCR